jgi:hypothetical protein
LRGETGLAVDNERPGRADEDRVEVKFDQFGNLLGNVRDRLKDRYERAAIDSRCAPVAVKQWRGAQ